MAEIYNSKHNTLVSGTKGNDFIENYSGKNVTLDGGAGDDSVYSDGYESLIDGGAGNDSLYFDGQNSSTIIGGTGNDTIHFEMGSEGNVIQYADGDGDDVIQLRRNCNEYSSLLIDLTQSTLDDTLKTDKGDIVLKTGEGSLTLKDARSTGVSVKTSDDEILVINERNYLSNSVNGATINETVGDWYIDNDGWNVSINTGAGNDYIGNYGGNVANITKVTITLITSTTIMFQ